MRVLAICFALSSVASSASAEGETADLTIIDPIAYETSAMVQAGAGYLSVTNTGDEDDVLLAVEADFPRVMLHETVMDGDVARMKHLMHIPVPAGETVTLAPGGKHVMFMGLGNDPLEAGEDVPATLIFENAGRVEVVFRVVARPDGS